MDDGPEPVESDDRMIVNSVGSSVWRVDDMKRLHRFLVLGSEVPIYSYIDQETLSKENARSISNLLQAGRGLEVVNEILKYSTQGRTIKQQPLMFALAQCARQGDEVTKRKAYEVLPQVCRIPTHLFMFIGFCETLSMSEGRPTTGWGRAHRKAVKNWYITKASDPLKLAMDITKYQKREGWSHRDVARLTHLKPVGENVPDGLFTIMMYIARGWEEVTKFYFPQNGTPPERTPTTNAVLAFLKAVEDMKALTVSDESQIVDLIHTYNLVREHIPTACLRSVQVWRALERKMPMTAMIRNLGKMTSVGLLEEGSEAAQHICDKLTDIRSLKQARIHPFNVLVALKTYMDGHGDRGSLTWEPNEQILEALEKAFYYSFKLVESTNKKYLLAIDVSGSMSYVGCAGASCITPRVASAAMSMVVAKSETEHHFVAFSNELIPLMIDRDMSLDEVLQLMKLIPMGGTDCALPMKYAMENNLDVDVFVVYTDCETRQVDIHPSEALRQYRKQSGNSEAKLIVVAMTSNGFTIADPDDPGMFDMVGFDSHSPEVMREFILGNI